MKSSAKDFKDRTKDLLIITELLDRRKIYVERKSLGQIKLVKSSVLEKISDLAHKDDVVIEIGGGDGNLTELLSKKSKMVISFEIDERFKEELLEKLNYGAVIVADFLTIPIQNIKDMVEDAEIGRKLPVFFKGDPPEVIDVIRKSEKFKVIANIPFYISSRLIHKLITTDFSMLKEVHILVQKEFAQKICAQPGTEGYSAISAVTNLFFETRISFDAPRFYFRPVPKVHSSLLSLIPRPESEAYLQDAQAFLNFAYDIFRKRKRKVQGAKRIYQLSPQELFSFFLFKHKGHL